MQVPRIIEHRGKWAFKVDGTRLSTGYEATAENREVAEKKAAHIVKAMTFEVNGETVKGGLILVGVGAAARRRVRRDRQESVGIARSGGSPSHARLLPESDHPSPRRASISASRPMPVAPVRARRVANRSSASICAAWIGTAIQKLRQRHTSAPSASPPSTDR